MNRRFFSETVLQVDRSVELQGQEAQHLGRVLRAKPGDQVVLFDGSGAQFPAEVTEVARNTVCLTPLSREVVDRESPRQVHLAVAMPKGDRQKWLIEKAVELGVARLTPLKTERGVAQPTDSALKRLQRAVIEASKQCGRNRLMQVDEAVDWDHLLEARSGEANRWIAHPAEAAEELQISNTESVCVAVGPEGGFSDEEVQAASEAGWRCCRLGARILRVETAALKLAALLTN